MRPPQSLLTSSVLHVTLIVGACVGWTTYAVSEPSQVRLVFLPTEAAPAPSDPTMPEEAMVVEPVETELPDPPELTEPPVRPFEPPDARSPALLPPSAAEPSDPLARVVPWPAAEHVVTPPSPIEESSYVEARAIDAINRPPVYPPLAVRREWTGVVELEVILDAAGTVMGVSVAESSGHAILDHAAADAAGEWRFEPAVRDGVRVGAVLNIPVEFRIL